tara:strand:+ start:4321 stop:4470 length:150 start_codon:yes stop_codon:yes gene_type:complete
MVELLQLTQAVITVTAVSIAIPVAVIDGDAEALSGIKEVLNTYEQVDRN